MIRTKSKIYGELNDPNTVTSNIATQNNKFLIGDGLKKLITYTPGPNTILIVDALGRVGRLMLTGQTNKYIGTDGDGNIVLIDRSEFSD